MPRLTDLIEHLGTSAFSATLFRSTFDWAKASHLTAFAFEPGQRPQVIFAENTGTAPVAREVADLYCRDYWRHDLANSIAANSAATAEPHESWILHTQASEIAHSNYRRCCYTAVCLDHRVSLIETKGNRTLRINLYRTRGDIFTDEDVDRIADRALLILALARRHADYGAASRQNSLAYYRDRLTDKAPLLTQREKEVCAAIILGLTSEGIALELGVGVNTVLTYKKRAYTRLGISSQNELMHLVLN
ncbi:helix-turn-helix transcriptional regulator [Bradyrhizobium sp. ma5]|uniref:helix-turn-helix transcriptional regulator n=1 Tax=Bradyrhizobium sp. ma5 TaxID=3344828 RepID=UPI0035D4B7D0